MNISQLGSDLAVSPQISPSDLDQIAAAGFKILINNRPDSEVDDDMSSDVMRQAAEKAGLTYHYIPFTPGQLTPDLITAFEEAKDGRPALAYCRSGNRSSVLWALSQAGRLASDDIMERAASAGHDLSSLRPMLDTWGNQRR